VTDLLIRLRVMARLTGRDDDADTSAEAAREIERLRSGGACPHVRGPVTQHCSLNFTLTDAERQAIELAMSKRLDLDAIYTLRSLLERLK